MEKLNLFCDVADCGAIASVFTLQGSVKEKSCSRHLANLAGKKLTMYDIIGFNFISSFEDTSAFEHRKTTVQRGLGNLSAVEAQCDSELSEACALLAGEKQKAIAVVERCFRDLELQVQRKHAECKQQLQAVRTNFDLFLVSKSEELRTPAELILRNTLTPMKFICLTVSNPLLSIAKAIIGSWKVSPESVESTLACMEDEKHKEVVGLLCAEMRASSKNRQTQLLEENDFCIQALEWNGSPEELATFKTKKQVEDLREIERLCQLAVDSTNIKSIATGCLEVSRAEMTALQFPESLRWLHFAWDALQTHSDLATDTVAVGLVLGQVLSVHLGRYKEAEQILEQSCAVQRRIDALSEEEMKLENAMAGMFYNQGKWSRIEEVCERVLQTFVKAKCGAEHFWTTLLYYTFSCWQQCKAAKAQEIVEKWRDCPMRGEDKLSEMLKSIVLARSALSLCNFEEAEEFLVQARAISQQEHATSVLAALSLHISGEVFDATNRQKEAEDFYLCAQKIYDAVSPASIEAALNLSSMGSLKQKIAQLTEAAKYYEKARTIYMAVSPVSMEAAMNLSRMGSLNKDLKQFTEAQNYYRRAEEIYENVYPTCVEAAANYHLMGSLSKNSLQFDGVENYYCRARDICKRVSWLSPDVGYLILLGDNSEQKTSRSSLGYLKAEYYYRKAQAIYDAVAPISLAAAKNLISLGKINEKNRCHFKDSEFALEKEALEFYLKAQEVFKSEVPLSTHSAKNLMRMGNICRKSSQFQEAEQYYRMAEAIFEAVSPQALAAAENLVKIGTLCQNSMEFTEAEQYYRRAQAVYEQASPQSIDSADNLVRLGTVCRNTSQFPQAEQFYQSAKAIYEAEAPQSYGAANAHYNLGLLYEAMKKPDEAIHSLQAAQLINSKIDWNSADVQQALTRVQESLPWMSRWFRIG